MGAAGARARFACDLLPTRFAFRQGLRCVLSFDGARKAERLSTEVEPLALPTELRVQPLDGPTTLPCARRDGVGEVA
jgi:hypothetical protein